MKVQLRAQKAISPYPPESVNRPIMLQSWGRITFLHWAYEPGVLRARLPGGVELDTLEGVAWVGMTPFIVDGLRPPSLPALPWLSRFPETNVRTYVRGPDGQRGVWFFSLYAARLLAVIGARVGFSLPYQWAQMTVDEDGQLIRYRSFRRDAMSNIQVEIGGNVIGSSDFDNFLTARYRLYTARAGRLMYAQVEHPPWPLRKARLRSIEQTLLASNGLPAPVHEPFVHFSDGVTTRIGPLKRA
jgi:uncharacterized protein YqjF (DUF2071 family)